MTEEYSRWRPEHIITVTKEAEQRSTETSRQAGTGLSEAELAYVRAVVESPGEKSGFYAKKLRINGGRASRLRERLIELGFLREHRVATGGRHAKVLEPLEAAREALAEKGER